MADNVKKTSVYKSGFKKWPLLRKCLVRLGGKGLTSAVVFDVILFHNLLSLVVKISQILYFFKQYPDLKALAKSLSILFRYLS